MRFALNLVCLVICLSIKAQDQTRNFISYTTREGLSNNWAPSLIQDSRKFLWIGTREGLNRFDGHHFKKYFNQQHVFNSLSNNYVSHILEYKYGQLLIATNSGLSVLNTLTGQFENEKIDFAPLKAGSGNAILCIFKIADGKIWANHNGEIDVLDSNLKYLYRLTDIPWAKSLKGSLIYKDGQTDSHQRIWLTTDTSGIQIIDFSVKQVYNSKNNPQQLGFLNTQHYVRTILLDEPNHILWYAPWGLGLIKYDLLTNKEQQQLFGLKKNSEFSSANAIIQKDSLHLLCALGDGMYEVDINFLSHTKIAYRIVGAIFIRTAENQFWAGTGNGIIRLNGTYSFISKLSFAKPDLVFEKDDFCTGITVTQNEMLYCTYKNNRLFEIDKARTSFTAYKISGRSDILLSEVCEDKTGQLWVGTNEGIFFFDRKSKKFSRPFFQPPELYSRMINVIYCDHNGDVWIGTRGPFGLYKFNAVKKSIEKITNEVIDRFTTLYSDSRVSGIAEDNMDNIWMYSMLGGGIINYNKTSDRWKMYPVSNYNKSMMVEKPIASFYAGENNNLWFCNYMGNGLMCYNYLLDSITRFTRNEGLTSDYVQKLITDPSNNLWVSTDYSLTKFNLQNHKAISYDLQNVLAAPFEYEEAIFDPLTSRLVYGMSDRLLFIAPEKFTTNSSKVVPIIDNVFVNNKTDFSYAKGEKAWLKHNENNISIEFTGVNFSTTHEIQFVQQLTGLDTGWKVSDASRSAQYSNLAPGDYSFNIKTLSENGEWSKAYELFKFTIRPVFWQTAWFLFLIFCFVSFLIFWLVSRRIRIIRKEGELKHKLSEAEMIALRSQMNPHFIFNSLNAIDNLIQTKQSDKATTYLSRFAKLIRSVLESSKNNTVPFYKDFETLELFIQLEQFRCNNKFTYEMHADQELLDGDYKVPPLIIQPFVENAIHHGLLNRQEGERKLLVTALLEDNFIKYTISDNGVGRIKAQEIKKINKPEHQSYGMHITTERIHLHNQDSTINDAVVITDLINEGKPNGTEIKINLKI